MDPITGINSTCYSQKENWHYLNNVKKGQMAPVKAIKNCFCIERVEYALAGQFESHEENHDKHVTVVCFYLAVFIYSFYNLEDFVPYEGY